MSKFDQIESGWVLTPFESLNRPPLLIPAPRNVTCIPKLIAGNDGATSYSLDIQWQFPITALLQRESWITSYYVEFRRGISPWGNRQEVTQLYARYENVGSGRFFARVAAVCSANGKVSRWEVSPAGVLTTVQAIADASNPNNSFWVTEV